MSEAPRRPDLPPVPDDVIHVVNGRFVGNASFWKQGPGGLEPLTVSFDAPTSRRPLSPFTYDKPPIIGKVGVVPAEKDIVTSERSGNIPLVIVEDRVLRWPNHLYNPSKGLVTAVYNDEGVVGTRFYPQDCLKEPTLKEAEEIIRNDKEEVK
jgi:hypothetical protein